MTPWGTPWPEFWFILIQSFIFAAFSITVTQLALFVWKEVMGHGASDDQD